MNKKKRSISFPKNLAILGLILLGFVLPANAITVTWTGGGADNLVSNPANWGGSIVPQNADDVIFDNTSTEDCTWDVSVALASLSLNAGYTGTVTLISDLKVIGNVVVSDGTLNQNNKNLIIGFYPPAATTDSGTSTNGDSVTLYATVNPNGLDTTAYFECGTDTSYGITTTIQSIGNGTDDVTISDSITGLLPETTYNCRVVVTNAAGTSYGNDVSFTTTSIILYITSPFNNDTINRPDVMVKGTVTNTTGNETGVTVNGIVAVVYNGEFFVNHLPLNDGTNTITVSAVDTANNTASFEINVDAIVDAPHVTLNANIDSGIAPLTSYFSALTSIPNTVMSYESDYEGDATVDYTGTAFDNISFTYAVEGIYYPSITVTDDQDITYTDTMAVVVLNKTYIESLIGVKWGAMRSALLSGDIVSGISYFVEESKSRYDGIFSQMSSSEINSIFLDINDFKVYSITQRVAQCGAIRAETGGTYSYPVTFVKDENGIWKIMGF